MKSHTGSGFIRIVGGEFKGRRLAVLNLPQLRPTSDRVRETLFNWLSFDIQDAYCLDLFSGSGALGFEAISRGAKWVTFIEQHPKLCEHLRACATTLKCEAKTDIIRADTLKWLDKASEHKPFDVVFLDPPFDKNLWLPCLARLLKANVLHEKSLVYLEAPKQWDCATEASTWDIKKQQIAGQVGYYLLQPRLTTE